MMIMSFYGSAITKFIYSRKNRFFLKFNPPAVGICNLNEISSFISNYDFFMFIFLKNTFETIKKWVERLKNYLLKIILIKVF